MKNDDPKTVYETVALPLSYVGKGLNEAGEGENSTLAPHLLHTPASGAGGLLQDPTSATRGNIWAGDLTAARRQFDRLSARPNEELSDAECDEWLSLFHLLSEQGPRASYVYFIAAGDRVKIGVSTNLRGRLSDLQTSSPLELSLVAVVSGERALERRLHEFFAKDRLHGEWFSLSEEIQELLAWLDLGATIENAMDEVEDLRAEMAREARGERLLARLRSKVPAQTSSEPLNTESAR